MLCSMQNSGDFSLMRGELGSMKRLNKSKIIPKLKTIIPCMIFPTVMFGLLGPIEFYGANVKSFGISIWDVFFAMGLASLIGCIGGVILLSVLPMKLSRVLCMIILAFSLTSYVQYLFINSILASPDGNAIDWSALHDMQIRNTIIWVIVFGAVLTSLFLLKKYWERIGSIVPVLLTLVQLVAIVSLLVTTPIVGREQYRLSAEGQFSLAKDDNIIVLVLDAYGNCRFEEYTKRHPELLGPLKDFTYYDNADSHYVGTYPSVTAMWTRAEYDGEEEGEFFHTAWKSDTSERFFDKLHDNGWSFGLYGENQGNFFGNLTSAAGKIDNNVYEGITIRYKRILVRFTRESLFIFSPYLLKPYFEEITSNFKDTYAYAHPFSDRQITLNRILNEEGFEIMEDVPKRIIHLHSFGAHSLHDENDLHFLDEAHEFVNNYLKKLDELGKYDSSTIIIMADHGAIWGWLVPDPQPIFLIKRSGESHDSMQLNHAPISHDDMQGTILDIIGVEKDEETTSIYDWSEGQQRERHLIVPALDEEYCYYQDREELLKVIEAK